MLNDGELLPEDVSVGEKRHDQATLKGGVPPETRIGSKDDQDKAETMAYAGNEQRTFLW